MDRHQTPAGAPAEEHLALVAAVTADGDHYVAQCLQIDVASQGTSRQEALDNLSQALTLYLDHTPQAVIEPAPEIATVHVPIGRPADRS
ncbi:type II toxin-antitoxin system HicB family antitoxin [Saccharothrix xinjiangensis]|uniref:Type II toxin-antitoxin system HicB family antitoxin n=1 Tax=Saccharothrix xinjiangensis TaxID=204798 RepID=A0ABV9Y030_9PSEU